LTDCFNLISDPDLQAGDGVYSRHLTWRPGLGVFYLKLTITDKQGGAYTASPGPKPVIQQPAGLTVPICCGSRVPVPESRRRPVGLFLRNFRLAFAAAAGSPPASDTIPPAKIGDFAVQQVAEAPAAAGSSSSSSNLLTGSWTAVGGDYHDGEADHYRILYAAALAELLLPRERDTTPAVPYIELANTDQSGSRTSHNFTLNTNATGLLYLAVQAVDSAGNGGRVSNPVRIWLVDRSPNDTASTEAQTNGGTVIVEDWAIIGIVVGIIAFVLVTLVTLVLCLLCWRRGNARRASKIKIRTTRSSGVNVHIPSPTRSDATDVSYESEHQLVPAMSKPPPPPSSTSFANNITPTYWSASQLLSEHEQRTKSLERKVYRDHYSGHSKATALNSGGSQNNSIYNGYTVTPYSDAYGDISGLMPPAYGETGKISTSGGISSSSMHNYNNNNTNIYGDFRNQLGGIQHNLDYGTVTVKDLAALDIGGGGGGPLYGGGGDVIGTTMVPDSEQGDYGSDLVDEGMGASGSSTKSRVNISDASSATLPMFNSSLRGSLMSLNSNLSKKRHMTQV
jgi:hypothetical protein